MRPAPAKKRRGKNRRPLKAATLRRLRSQNWKHGRRAGPAGIAAHYLTELYAAEPGLEAAMQNKKLVRKLVTLKTPEERGGVSASGRSEEGEASGAEGAAVYPFTLTARS